MSTGIHTCHAECPCHSGGKPTPDFVGYAPDTEGYIVRAAPTSHWVICNRFGVQIDNEPLYSDYSRALMRAATLNDAVHARRFT